MKHYSALVIIIIVVYFGFILFLPIMTYDACKPCRDIYISSSFVVSCITTSQQWKKKEERKTRYSFCLMIFAFLCRASLWCVTGERLWCMWMSCCNWSCLCMQGNSGPVCGPAEIIGQPASMKIALIMEIPISQQQLDPLVYAYQGQGTLRLAHLAAYAPHWVTSSEGCAFAMCVSISRVNDLCVIIPHRRKQAGTANLVLTWWRPRLAPVSQRAAKCGALH